MHLAIVSVRADLVEMMLRDGRWHWSDRTKDGWHALARAHAWMDGGKSVRALLSRVIFLIVNKNKMMSGADKLI